MKRIVSLWFPKLSTDRLARTTRTPSDRGWSARAAATVVWLDGCPRLAAVNPHARSAGGYGGDAGLLLDVTGCAHLFGKDEAGERALLADLTERLSRHDLACRAALADTAGAAWALARFAERQADLFCPARSHRATLAPLPNLDACKYSMSIATS